MALCHIVEGSISFCLVPVPMKLFPFFAQQSSKRIAFRQGHPNAKVSDSTRLCGWQIVTRMLWP